MSFWTDFWDDESGMVLSAEAVTVGTVGVLGSIVGLNAAGNAVNSELKEMASAIRSLDQSYGYRGQVGCRAWSAGSCYVQQNVEQSLAELNSEADIDTKAIQQKILEERKAHGEAPAATQPVVDPSSTVEPRPNQLPKPEVPTSK